MHRALYRKWRPLTFSDVVGQEHITKVLAYEVENNRTSHAYLFCGSRGTGKTTSAKILAKAVNCESPVNGDPCGKCEYCQAIESGVATDILEMDAASNTGVDYIRDIKNEVMYSPSLLKNRVYIIDEVHMLTDSAFNALLKTLEEPPANVIFILATTEKHKIPSTILSRCQKFDFRRIPNNIIADRLLYIAENENIDLSPSAASLIARLSFGGMRDAISLLELCSSDNTPVTERKVADISGIVGREKCRDTVIAIKNKDCGKLFRIVADVYYSSSDLSSFWNELISYYRDLLVVKSLNGNVSTDILDVPQDELQGLVKLSSEIDREALIYQSTFLEEVYMSSMGKQSNDKRQAAEMALIRMTDPSFGSSNEAVLARLSTIEAKLKTVGSAKTAQIPVKEEPQITEKPQVKSEEREAPKVEEPKVQASTPKTEKKSNDTPISDIDWSEIVGVYKTTCSSSAPFLEDASAFISDSAIVTVYVTSSFAITMLEFDNAKAVLENIMSNLGITVDRVILKQTEKRSDADTSNDVF